MTQLITEHQCFGQQALVLHLFEQQFQCSAELICHAPGRVNLIGDHTDYNDGFVMPLATEGAVWMAVRPIKERSVRLYSIDFDEQTELGLDNLRASRHVHPLCGA